MPGFFVTNYKDYAEPNDMNSKDYVYESCKYDSYVIWRNSTRKFFNDKTLFQDENYMIVMEGVLLNKKDMYVKYKIKTGDVAHLAITMYEQLGEKFFSEFRGSFSGALYDKRNREWIIYTNQYGDNAVYYYFEGDKFIIGSRMGYIVDTLKKNRVDYSLDEHAIHSMLTYAYMSNDMTYVKEIKRLLPGCYIKIEDGKHNVTDYFKIRQNVYDLKDMSEEEIIDEIDRRFRDAVRLEYEKDVEYGYRHFAQLSGGLDSRMSLWVAHDMGYKDVLCITYGQSNCVDEKVAKQVAGKLGYEIMTWTLDSAKILFQIDEYIALNEGASLYSAPSATVEVLQNLNREKIGLFHTGQLGDGVLGSSYISSLKEMKNMKAGGVYSNRLLKPSDDIEVRRFDNREQYMLFVRGFLGITTSQFFIRNYTEASSAFLNVEFFEYCLSIPLELKVNHCIYKKWIIKKYPEAAEIIWEKTNQKITEVPIKRYLKLAKLALQHPKLVLKKLGFKVKVNVRVTDGMNPVDLWWKTNLELRKLYNTYFLKNIESPFLSKEIKTEFQVLYNNGNMIEKIQAITALGAINYLFGNRKLPNEKY